MTSNKKRVRLSDIIGPAFYETHKLIDMGVIDEAVESGGRASLKVPTLARKWCCSW